MGNKFLALRKSEVAKVAPDRTALEDLVQVLKTPIKLADRSLLNLQSNSINIASGMRIAVNDGHILTVKPQGVEVSGGDNPYDTESYLKAQKMADSHGCLQPICNYG